MRPGLNKKAASAAVGPAAGVARGPIGPAGPPQPVGAAPPDRRVERQPAEKADEDGFAWAPPQDQTGDGKTALNKKLGY